jgi:hypothetical protein
MDPASLVSAMTAAQMGAAQVAVAAKLIRMNADNAASIAKVLEAAQQNMNNLANLAAGVGQSLDIRV